MVGDAQYSAMGYHWKISKAVLCMTPKSTAVQPVEPSNWVTMYLSLVGRESDQLITTTNMSL